MTVIQFWWIFVYCAGCVPNCCLEMCRCFHIWKRKKTCLKQVILSTVLWDELNLLNESAVSHVLCSNSCMVFDFGLTFSGNKNCSVGGCCSAQWRDGAFWWRGFTPEKEAERWLAHNCVHGWIWFSQGVWKNYFCCLRFLLLWQESVLHHDAFFFFKGRKW